MTLYVLANVAYVGAGMCVVLLNAITSLLMKSLQWARKRFRIPVPSPLACSSVPYSGKAIPFGDSTFLWL